VPRFELYEINSEDNFEVAGISVMPIEVMHGRMPVLGFRFGNFTYITDAKTISEESLEKIKGTEVLVLNALHQKTHHSHFSLNEALSFIEQAKPKQAYLTHSL